MLVNFKFLILEIPKIVKEQFQKQKNGWWTYLSIEEIKMAYG